LDFDLKTNLVVNLPMDSSVPITALCLTSSNIWIGTSGAGLIEFEKASRQCRRFTETDGLMMDYLSSLCADGDLLWIGYGSGASGGLGQLDLHSQKIKSFTPSLNANSFSDIGKVPPKEPIGNIVADANGDLWMQVGSVIRQFHVRRDTWETQPDQHGIWVTSFSADSERLVEGGGISLFEMRIQDWPNRNTPTNDLHNTNMVVSSEEWKHLEENLRTNGNHRYVWYSGSDNIRPKAVLAIQNLRDHHWQNLEDAEGIPNPPSTMTLDGSNLWIGGEGFIALVDLTEGKVRKFCHISAARVDRIQIGGGYVWAQFDWQLYRASLSDLQ
jgi:hypothetical protein